jgi:hypothetical protein
MKVQLKQRRLKPNQNQILRKWLDETHDFTRMFKQEEH